MTRRLVLVLALALLASPARAQSTDIALLVADYPLLNANEYGVAALNFTAVPRVGFSYHRLLLRTTGNATCIMLQPPLLFDGSDTWFADRDAVSVVGATYPQCVLPTWDNAGVWGLAAGADIYDSWPRVTFNLNLNSQARISLRVNSFDCTLAGCPGGGADVMAVLPSFACTPRLDVLCELAGQPVSIVDGGTVVYADAATTLVLVPEDTAVRVSPDLYALLVGARNLYTWAGPWPVLVTPLVAIGGANGFIQPPYFNGKWLCRFVADGTLANTTIVLGLSSLGLLTHYEARPVRRVAVQPVVPDMLMGGDNGYGYLSACLVIGLFVFAAIVPTQQFTELFDERTGAILLLPESVFSPWLAFAALLNCVLTAVALARYNVAERLAIVMYIAPQGIVNTDWLTGTLWSALGLTALLLVLRVTPRMCALALESSLVLLVIVSSAAFGQTALATGFVYLAGWLFDVVQADQLVTSSWTRPQQRLAQLLDSARGATPRVSLPRQRLLRFLWGLPAFTRETLLLCRWITSAAGVLTFIVHAILQTLLYQSITALLFQTLSTTAIVLFSVFVYILALAVALIRRLWF